MRYNNCFVEYSYNCTILNIHALGFEIGMIKSELILKLAKELPDLSERKINDAVNHILNCMTDALVQGQRIEVRGFGSFTVRHRAARSAHNPKTGEQVFSDETRTPHFKPGKNLKESVNSSYGTFTK